MALCTTAEYKAYLNTIDASRDTQIGLMITYVQSLAERALGMKFDSTTITERYSVRPGDQTIQLRTYPVTSVTSIKAFYGSGSSDNYTLSSSAYYVNLTNGIVSIIGAGQQSQIFDYQGYPLTEPVIGVLPTFQAGIDVLEVTYVAGNASIPAGLKYCAFRALDIALAMVGNNPLVQSESIGDFSHSFFAGDKSNSADVISQMFAQYQSGAML